MEYSKTDLANETGVSRSTLYRRWETLENLSILKESRKYQNTQLYKLNTDSPTVNELGRLRRRLEEETDSVKAKRSEAVA